MAAAPTASGAEMAVPAVPTNEIREFAFTRVKPSGSRRGTADALVTPYAFEATRQPRAAGNNAAEPETTASASTQQQNARMARVPPIAQRRPRRNRSRNGPMRGATIANGNIVSNRNEATSPRAS